MKNIFTYMFGGENYIKKLAAFFGFIFIAVLLLNLAISYNPVNMLGEWSVLFFVFLILGIIASFIPAGYFVSCIKNCENDSNVLPDFEYKNLFLTGGKLLTAFFLFAISVFIILLILSSINIIAIEKQIVFISFLLSSAAFLLTIIISFVIVASLHNFVKTNDLFSFVRIPAVIKTMNKNVNKYFKYYFLFIGILLLTLFIKGVLYTYLNFLGYTGLVIYSVLVSLLYTYFAPVGAKIVSNSIEK